MTNIKTTTENTTRKDVDKQSADTKTTPEMSEGAATSYAASSYQKPLGKTMWFQAYEAGYSHRELELEQLKEEVKEYREALEECVEVLEKLGMTGVAFVKSTSILNKYAKSNKDGL